ncbi:MAG TPA: class I SAM-dependent methyltransferase [Patescibacteria group bacterium]
MKIKQIITTYFNCPDCHNQLNSKRQIVVCSNCKRKIYFEENFVDLLPLKPLPITCPFSTKAYAYYCQQFLIPANSQWSQPTAFNAETHSSAYRAFIDAEYQLLRQLLPDNRQVAVDISGGAGTYSRSLTTDFNLVFHCDISIESLRYAQKKANKMKIHNCVFIRADYLRLPFKPKVLDFCLSTDSFIYYGPKWDIFTLRQLKAALSTNGKIFFDVHYRKWYYPDSHIFEYTWTHLKILQHFFPTLELIPFGRVPELFILHPTFFVWFNRLTFLPPIRYLGVISKQS